MIKKILAIYLNKKIFLKGSAILALTALASNLLGLLRDRILAQKFGASIALDAYNAAFVVPNLILNIFVAGALMAAFIPIFSELIYKSGGKESQELLNSAINSSLFAVASVGIIVFIFAESVSNVIVPGFDPAAKKEFVGLMRLFLLSPIIFSLSNAIGSALVSFQKFFWYGISASFYNIGIIAGTIFLGGHYGIKGAAIGVIAGALLHLVARLIGIGKKIIAGYRPVISWNENFKKYLKLMVPRMIGQPIEQFIFWGFTAIASTIGAGAIVVLNIANNFQTVPVSIIGVTFATTAFPLLSKLSAAKNKKLFVSETWFAIKSIVLTTVPIAVFMYLFREPIISFLIGGRQFGPEAVSLTAATLGMFTPSIITENINHLLARAFYALKNSIIPTTIALLGLAAAIGSGYYLSPFMGVPGLALGFFIGSGVKILLHLAFFSRIVNKNMPC